MTSSKIPDELRATITERKEISECLQLALIDQLADLTAVLDDTIHGELVGINNNLDAVTRLGLKVEPGRDLTQLLRGLA